MDKDHPAEGGRLGELYDRFAPAGIRLAYLLTGDRALAQDLVQDAFVRLVGRLQHLRDPDAFAVYLKRTIFNLSKNHFRRRAVERNYLQHQAGQRQDRNDPPDFSSYEMMRSAMLGLPARQRAALVLRYYEDLPENEIAAILGCAPSTVRSLVARGLQTLRQDPEVTR